MEIDDELDGPLVTPAINSSPDPFSPVSCDEDDDANDLNASFAG
jgi:hypothetical protein